MKKSVVAMPKAQTDKDRSAGAGGPSQTSLAGECLVKEARDGRCLL